MPHILIVEARFYNDFSDALLAGAVALLQKAEASYEIVTVPGALEIPIAIRIAMACRKYDGFVALGCVIRGETSHYDTVCQESARGLMQLGSKHAIAIGNGIITVENEEQAWARAQPTEQDKGGFAANACLALLTLKEQLYDRA